ncbi:MAG: hypothetical protein ABIO29_05570 [Sphingomicrobium sp.]
MAKIDRYFLLLAGLMLLSGVFLGIHMAGQRDFQLAPIHAHANLVGWASLALFGLFYRAYPALKAHWLAKAHFALAAISAILMPLGIYRAVVLQVEDVAMVASVGWLLATLCFIAQTIRLLRAPAD